MLYLENIIRRVANLIGWEIKGAIENVIWSVVIGCFLIFCCICGCLAVSWRMIANSIH